MGKTNDELFWKYRSKVYNRLREWEGGHCREVNLLAELLGYPDPNSMCKNFSEKDIQTCQKLSGPHGYVIYKALLARRNR